MSDGELDWVVARRKGTAVQWTSGAESPVRPGPVRTCVGCRSKATAAELLRVVVVDGRLVPDVRRRLPGRGAWLHVDPGCLRLAERRRAFSRALRVPGPLDAEALSAHLRGEN